MTAYRAIDIALKPNIHACTMKDMVAAKKFTNRVSCLNCILTDCTGGIKSGCGRIDNGAELKLLGSWNNGHWVEEIRRSAVGDIAKGGSKGNRGAARNIHKGLKDRV
jgi:hypothetical protein